MWHVRIICIKESHDVSVLENPCSLDRCSNQTVRPVRCLPGEYAPAGQTNCSLCTKGFHCPDVPLASPLPCFNGTYTDKEGQVECKLCTAGNFCPFASQREQPCENGTYSKSGSSVCTECPSGHRLDLTISYNLFFLCSAYVTATIIN